MRGRPKSLMISLTEEDRDMLTRLSVSATAGRRTVQRARILLMADEGSSNTDIAAELNVSKPTVIKTVKKCVAFGAARALEDTPRSGRPNRIGTEEKAWVTSLACRPPQQCADGSGARLWTIASLTEYIRRHCEVAGFPALQSAVGSTVWGILNEDGLRQHRTKYCLERKEPGPVIKPNEVFLLYRRVSWILQHAGDEVEQGERGGRLSGEICLSCDGKPGMQDGGNMAPDGTPVFRNAALGRDCEPRRHGTVSLLAGIDLLSGEVSGIVRETHESPDFIDFLKAIDRKYPQECRIRMILDNHRVHSSKAVMDYLAGRQGRFAFTFTPKHASWLNLVECFFGRLARQALRGLRVSSGQALTDHIEAWLNDVNETPADFRWERDVEDIRDAFAR